MNKEAYMNSLRAGLQGFEEDLLEVCEPGGRYDCRVCRCRLRERKTGETV